MNLVGEDGLFHLPSHKDIVFFDTALVAQVSHGGKVTFTQLILQPLAGPYREVHLNLLLVLGIASSRRLSGLFEQQILEEKLDCATAGQGTCLVHNSSGSCRTSCYLAVKSKNGNILEMNQ